MPSQIKFSGREGDLAAVLTYLTTDQGGLLPGCMTRGDEWDQPPEPESYNLSCEVIDFICRSVALHYSSLHSFSQHIFTKSLLCTQCPVVKAVKKKETPALKDFTY